MFKSKLLLSSILLFIGLFSVSETNSVFSEQATIAGNNVSVDYWAEVSFYLRGDNLAVGFKMQNVSPFTGIHYTIDYTHDGGLPEHIEGAIDNSGGESTILREWFALGGCSGLGEVCWNHEVEGQINLTVELLQGGIVVETLTKSISI